MERFLGSEYGVFLASYDAKRYYGLRRNPLKASAEEFAARISYELEPVAWAGEGYYYRESDQPGKDILHEAGAYYIQEPSAMAVAQILAPRPGERILDLCAAPGGKSTQIAGRMCGEGLLIANEVIPGRAKILARNIERMGIINCVVCNETPDRLAFLFPHFFDKILVDAPCSGEGMFRKDETAVEEWSEAHVKMCADRQQTILEEAVKMLKPGGVLVYSTCTFAPEENEGTVSRLVQRHPEFTIEEIVHDAAFSRGRPDWIEDPAPGLEHTVRLWPHRLRGEGHYIARLRREQGDLPDESRTGRRKKDGKERGRKETETIDGAVLQRFLTEEIGLIPDWLREHRGTVRLFGEQIYLVPEERIPLQEFKTVRPGLHLGTCKRNRMEPSHALALAMKPEETTRIMELSREEAARYLHGESLPCGTQSGWTLLTCRGYSIGFGKAVNGQMKNHYPKGLRR